MARRRKDGGSAEKHRVSLCDEIAEFEDFREKVLPDLRKALENGMTAEQIRKKYHAYLQAREISIGLTEEDPRVALTAIKRIIEAEEGKATEKKDISVKYEELSEEELDALIETELKESGPDPDIEIPDDSPVQ